MLLFEGNTARTSVYMSGLWNLGKLPSYIECRLPNTANYNYIIANKIAVI